MTLPIVHRGVGVGTVGITGSPDRIRRFGQVVKRQTEILLDEAVLLRSRMTRERVLETLLRDLLTYDADHLADLTVRAHDFGFDLALPRRVVLVEVADAAEPARRPVSSSPLRLIRELFHNGQDISASLSSVSYIVLRRHDAGSRESVTREDLVDSAARIRSPGRARRTYRHRWCGRQRRGDRLVVRRRHAPRFGSGRSTGLDRRTTSTTCVSSSWWTALPVRLRSRVGTDIIGIPPHEPATGPPRGRPWSPGSRAASFWSKQRAPSTFIATPSSTG